MLGFVGILAAIGTMVVLRTGKQARAPDAPPGANGAAPAAGPAAAAAPAATATEAAAPATTLQAAPADAPAAAQHGLRADGAAAAVSSAPDPARAPDVPAPAAVAIEPADPEAATAATVPSVPDAPAAPSNTAAQSPTAGALPVAPRGPDPDDAVLARMPPVRGPVAGETGTVGGWAPGVIAEYFADRSMTRRLAALVAPTITHGRGAGVPSLDAPAGVGAVRWSGLVLAPAAGSYQFVVAGGSSAVVAIDGLRVPDTTPEPTDNRQGWRAPRDFRSDPLQLGRGLHRIQVIMTEVGRDRWRDAGLAWLMPGGARVGAIGEGYLFHEVPAAEGDVPAGTLVGGLAAEVCTDQTFRHVIGTYTSDGASITFDDVPPLTICPTSGYSIRLSGFLLISAASTVGFELDSQHVCRLTVDGAMVAETGTQAARSPRTAEVGLAAGFRPIVIEYTPTSRPARAVVRWRDLDRGTGGQMRDLAGEVLFHRPATAVAVDRAGTTPGLACSVFANEELRGRPTAETIDPDLCVDLGRLRPTGVERNGWSAQWKGFLVVRKAGPYTFRVHRRGGVALVLGSATVVSDWRPTERWEKAQVNLPAGTVPLQVRYFSRTGDPMLEVYWSGPDFPLRRLRGDALVQKADAPGMAASWAGPPAAAAAGGAPADVQAQRPAATPAPGSPEAAAAAALPKGNLAPNGGFEEVDDKRFAAGWRPFRPGAASRVSVRLDSTNPHQGEQALVVRSAEGVAAGAFATLKLVAARYEIRVWASADVGTSAEVFAHLAGVDLAPQRVGEEWKELTFTATVSADHLQASIRVCTAADGVRVWFDDVSLVAVGPIISAEAEPQ